MSTRLARDGKDIPNAGYSIPMGGTSGTKGVYREAMF